jgi:sugar-specific transcriptional regulator TrmB
MSIISDQKEQELIKGLQEFGLSEKEALVYLALLSRRDVGSSKLIYATKLHKQFVYNALSRLEELGLAKHVIQNGRKKFSSNTPLRILSILEEKKLSAQSLTRQLQERFICSHDQDLEVFQGQSAFIAHQMDMIERSPQGGTINVISSETEHYKDILEEEALFDEYERLRIKKNISIRYIGSEAQREVLQQREKKQELWTYRILPGQSTGLVNTDVWTDNVTFNIFGNPLLSISITGKEIADGYREFFETLWKLSSK